MTQEHVTSRVRYTGDGETTVFDIPFYWEDPSEIAVVQTDADGAETVLVLNTDYTLDGAGSTEGTVAAAEAPAEGVAWTILRTTPLTQTTDLNRGGFWDAESAESSLDKLTRMAQDLWARLARALQLTAGSEDGAGVFDARGNRISNLATATLPSDAVTLAQVQDIAGSVEDAIESAQSAEQSATDAAMHALAAAGSATSASNSASAASASADAAAASAAAAADQAARLQGTSTSSVEIGTGQKSFVTQEGKLFAVGSYVTITEANAPATNWMAGQVTAYTGTALTVDVDQASGSGIFGNWTITVSGAPGETGPAGDPGTPGTPGDDGWSPVFALESDGERRVLKVVDWVGGEGTKPATNKYVGSTGLVDNIGDAIDVRGAPGAPGSGTGDMLAANNLSDVADVPTARTNLGLGTANAPQFAGVNIGHATDTTITRVAAGKIAVEGDNVLTQSQIGTTIQGYNALLASIAGLSFGVGTFIYGTGTNQAAAGTITTFGRSLIDDADAAAARATLQLGSLSVKSTINNADWSGTPLAITNGGTGATTASGARTALGLGSAAQADTSDFAPASHGHAISDVSGLQSALNGKASTSTTISAAGLATGGGDLSSNRTITVPECSAAEFRNATPNKAIAPDQAWAAAEIVALTYASTITINMAAGINFEVTLAGNPTLGTPTNPKVGQCGFIKINTNGTNRTMAYGPGWIAAGGAQDISTSNTTDYLFYQVVDASEPIIVYSLMKDPT